MLTLITRRSSFYKKIDNLPSQLLPKKKTTNIGLNICAHLSSHCLKKPKFFLLIYKIFGMIQNFEIVKNIHNEQYIRIIFFLFSYLIYKKILAKSYNE
jgi:hypothetical protein